jgi:hypothetical protein
MPARREDAAADFVARQFLALENYRFEPGVDETLGGGCGGQAGTDDDDVN